MSFQTKVNNWVIECFGEEILFDKHERGQRFIEEAIELVQSTGLSRETVLKLVDYVYNRPVGEVYQEVGGVIVTLAALCTCFGENLEVCKQLELSRISLPEAIIKIREKQKLKPRYENN